MDLRRKCYLNKTEEKEIYYETPMTEL